MTFRRSGLLALLALLSGGMLAALPSRAQDSQPVHLAQQQEQQKKVQADTERLVCRLATALRLLEYYHLEKVKEEQLLAELAQTLHGLSRQQMQEVLERLAAAAQAPSALQADKEQEIAYARHQEILAVLEKLLARYRALHHLEQTARALERLAQAQEELGQRTQQLAQGIPKTTPEKKSPSKSVPSPTPPRPPTASVPALRQQGQQQGDLARRLQEVLQQAAALRPQLPPAEQARLDQALAQAKERQLVEKMHRLAEQLAGGEKRHPVPPSQAPAVAARQRQAAEELRALAQQLRPQEAAAPQQKTPLNPSETAAAVHKLQKAQKQLREETTQAATMQRHYLLPLLQDEQQELAAQAQALAQRSSLLSADAQAALKQAAAAMQQAAERLRQRHAQAAQKEQEKALQALAALPQHLAQEITNPSPDSSHRPEPGQRAALEQAEKQLAHALAQTRQAAVQAQTAATKAPADASKGTLPQLAAAQKRLAEQAHSLDLKAAAEPAQQAAQALARQQPTAALAAQEKALAQLQAAAARSSSTAPAAAPLADTQQRLLEATRALAHAQEATQAALSAMGQAQAQVRPLLEPHLVQAGRQLTQAAQQLRQGQAAQAQQAHQQAAEHLAQALQVLQKTLAQLGPEAPTAPQLAQKVPSAASQEKSPSVTPSASQAAARASSREKNEPPGTGQRQAASPAPQPLTASGPPPAGTITFLGLPPRQREMIRQALCGRLPPEFADLIQQYYINLAQGRPAAAAPPPKRPGP
jgi:hypothetical protein